MCIILSYCEGGVGLVRPVLAHSLQVVGWS